MKPKIVIALCAALFAASLGIAPAADVKFSMDRKKLGQSNTRTGSTNAKARGTTNFSIENKDIIYTIFVESSSFKDLENVTVEYNIYYEEARPGSTEKPPVRTLAGKHTIDKLGSYKKVDFDTTPIVMKETRLDGGWVWTSGADKNAKDRIVGSIIRAHNSEGKLLGEYINPSGIATKFEWKSPR